MQTLQTFNSPQDIPLLSVECASNRYSCEAMRSFFSFSHFNAMQSTYAPQRQPQSLIALSAASWDGCWAEILCSGVRENLLPHSQRNRRFAEICRLLDIIMRRSCSLAISAPTACGKTTIFELAVLAMMSLPDSGCRPKAVYLAPTRVRLRRSMSSLQQPRRHVKLWVRSH